MYSFEDFDHLIILLIIGGVLLIIFRYFSAKSKEDENHSHLDA
jgi:hypothetical protein